MKIIVLVVACLSASLAASTSEKKIDKRGLSRLHDLRGGLVSSGDLASLSYAPFAPIHDYGANLGESANDAQIVTSSVPNLHANEFSYAPTYGYGHSLPLGDISPGHVGSGFAVSQLHGGFTPIPFRYGGFASGLPAGSLHSTHAGNIVSQHLTVTNRVAVPVAQPYPIPVERPINVPVHIPIRVPVDRPYPVPVPHRVPVPVDRPFAVPIDRPVPVPVAHPIPVPIPRPVAYPVARPVPVTNVITVPVSHPLFIPQPGPFVSSSPAIFFNPRLFSRPDFQGTNLISGPGALTNNALFSGRYAIGPPSYPSRVFADGPRYPIEGISLGGSLNLGPFGQISKQLNFGLRK